MDTIRLNNIALFAYHGIAPEEQSLGQRFHLDVELRGDFTAVARDNVAHSIDYVAAYHTVEEAFTAKAYSLLEQAGWQVLQALFQAYPVEEITLRVRKPTAPVGGILDGIELEMTRRREEVIPG